MHPCKCTYTQVWNHPWVLKLDEHRQAERAERLAMYGESEEEEDDSTSLEGFIVSGSEEEEDEEEKGTKKKAKKKSKKYEKVRMVLLLRANH